MHRKTEFAGQPSPFQVLRKGALAIVRLRENIVQLDPREDSASERWEADEYDLTCRWTDNIESRIEANTAAWLARAKETAIAQEAVSAEQLTQEARLSSAEGTIATHDQEISQIVSGLEALANG